MSRRYEAKIDRELDRPGVWDNETKRFISYSHDQDISVDRANAKAANEREAK